MSKDSQSQPVTGAPCQWAHGMGRQAELLVPAGTSLRPGRYGRMFPGLPALKVDDDALLKLADAMTDGTQAGDNPNIPSGFTYLGQFVDHDLTFDPTPVPEQRLDPLAVYNFRTPRLDLDSLYGLGPMGQPFLYDQTTGTRLLLGGTDGVASDLPRNVQGVALLGDPRNDDNLLVAQLHLAFLKFHNAVLASLAGDPRRPSVFEEARRLVTWHYQWIVVNELLDKLLEKGAVAKALARIRPQLTDEREPFIPVEFSVAAFRFGHTMVRPGYDYNAQNPSFSLRDALFFTGPTRQRPGAGDGNESSLPISRDKAIDWGKFFDLGAPGTTTQQVPANLSRRLDPLVASQLHDLFKHQKVSDKPHGLPHRNLIRGARVGLPSGQAVARALRLPVLDSEEIAIGGDGEVAKQNGLTESTPLWYYILKEAQVKGSGERLGPVGSAILADVFVRVLCGDPYAYLHQWPDWTPTLDSAVAGTFFMSDLLRFTEKRSPVINLSET